ncbi:MAG TPA: hypothetical protein VGT40_01775 [Methylomirabilota bacterium]|jgi:hypothetical protein|nr:hypothetical protein [Methylomirabilota bacterium]
MATRLSLLLLFGLVTSAAAEEWTRARIARLPDSAFAVVEMAPDGTKRRHLPHHDETGAVDPAHLRAALARLPQVKWLNPVSKTIARRHLEEHRRESSSKKSDDSVQRVIRLR